MKQKTKKMIGYGIVGVAIYYMFNSYRNTAAQIPGLVQDYEAQQARAQANASEYDGMFGIGNPPNWY